MNSEALQEFLDVATRLQRKPNDDIGNPELGARVAQLRKAAGLSQLQLAEKLGVTQPLISRYEKGDRRMYDDLIVVLAKALGVTPNDILGVSPSKPIAPDVQSISRRMVKYLKKVEALPRRAQDKVITTLELALKGATD
ncbi:MAG: helix-turn-helix transcriptional regulator [Planctomycetes bacterium]|nr:helix-turn-helix transcriptional regulator [Planctomycetota bacterium]